LQKFFSIIPTFKSMRSRFFRFFLGVITLSAASRFPGASGTRNSADVHRVAVGYDLIYPAYFGNRINIPADNPLTREGVYLGRILFYETRLSANNKVSCESCHQQRLAFTDGRAFSQGIDSISTPRSSMSLTNLLWGRSFFWDGRAAGLEQQAATPLSAPHEMGQSLERSAERLRHTRLYPPLFRSAFGTDSITGDQIVKALSQFERTLISADSRYDRYLRGQYQPNSTEARGMALFMKSPSMERNIRGANCEHCHASPRFSLEQFHNNGLDSIPSDPGRETLTGLPADRGRFKVPTLRNIALTAPYMHDGRFRTLEEVLDHYSEHIHNSASLSPVLQNAVRLTGQEKKDIISFLHMLTDSAFITDPRFSNPNIHDL
jgi:cytochrome c peroxidase